MDLYFYPSGAEPVRIHLGETSAQDLTCDLGPPLRVHYKEDDRMAIHSRRATEDEDVDADCTLSAVVNEINDRDFYRLL